MNQTEGVVLKYDFSHTDLELKYSPTESIIECLFSEGNVYIQNAESKSQNEGGFSILLSELEKIAKQRKASSLFLEVWETNEAIKKYTHKGFRKVRSRYNSKEEKNALFMQKDLK
ncbi:hypothetical protein HNV12_03745 [Methanococcoides sp. SA1]|nr:hypothetical protein [Methanococcoides sp. SA1]